MYRFENSDSFKKRYFIISDLTALQLVFLIPYFCGIWTYNLYFPLQIFTLLSGLSIMLLTDAYDKIFIRGYWKEFKCVFVSISIIYAIILAYMFLTKNSALFSRQAITLMYIGSLLLSYIGRISVKKLSLRYFEEKKNRRAVLLITTADQAEKVINTVRKNRFSDFKITGIGLISVDINGDIADNYAGVPVVATDREIIEYVKKNVVDEVLLTINTGIPVVGEVVEDCAKMGVVLHYMLDMPSKWYSRKEVEDFGGYSVLTCGTNIVSAKQLVVKRIIDVVGSLVGVLITGILFIFIAPIIYIKSPGPIFFTQERVGLNGRKFKVYKFRSMYMDAEERKASLAAQNKMDGFMFKIDDDPRIIKGIGNFIRKTSIDEFPQMLNVLKGDMSLVGTRPPTVDEFEKYDYHHKSRLATKPGITGMWQVSGRSNITDFEQVVELDNEYIHNWSVGLDLKIIFKTFLVVFKREGSA